VTKSLAVLALLVALAAVPVPPAAAPVLPAAAPSPGRQPYRWAGIVALLGVLAAGLVVVGAMTFRRGRARGWRLGG
jgi:hypothetical protein